MARVLSPRFKSLSGDIYISASGRWLRNRGPIFVVYAILLVVSLIWIRRRLGGAADEFTGAPVAVQHAAAAAAAAPPAGLESLRTELQNFLRSELQSLRGTDARALSAPAATAAATDEAVVRMRNELMHVRGMLALYKPSLSPESCAALARPLDPAQIGASENQAFKIGVISNFGMNFGLNVFVETGTHHGGTTQASMAVFDQLYTIELSEALYAENEGRFKDVRDRVHLIKGDAAFELVKLLDNLHSPALFCEFGSARVVRGCSFTCAVVYISRIIVRDVSGRASVLHYIHDSCTSNLPASIFLVTSISGYL